MKRLAVAAALAAAAVLSTGGGHAQAASATATDPVKSMKKQFVVGRGVLVSETARSTVSGAKGVAVARTTGTIGFVKSGTANHDLTTRWKPHPGMAQPVGTAPTRAIKVGRFTYVSGFEWKEMPAGAKWVRFGKDNSWWGNVGERGDQLVDVFNPAILKKLLAKATIARPGEYRGILTARDLYGEYSFADVDKVSFRLFVNRDQLPVRLITEHREKDTIPDKDHKLVKRTVHTIVDTRYTGWGTKVKIVAPPADEAVDYADLPGPFDQ
ncbi:hypothetical protein [Nonomuraea sp. NEAU-A123]|uniref:hypothetical protein n=1 Tax=Nonomuraea sp. NEAU-A123 TaxID=2839649 RepID=UPI001BE47A41|nr:hypothetical protein [Nonomuraea sp. NEAU-A123]MBT2227591.1 hypothetical protein [Nonomuraea sp. NEAU-A123]